MCNKKSETGDYAVGVEISNEVIEVRRYVVIAEHFQRALLGTEFKALLMLR